MKRFILSAAAVLVVAAVFASPVLANCTTVDPNGGVCGKAVASPKPQAAHPTRVPALSKGGACIDPTGNPCNDAPPGTWGMDPNGLRAETRSEALLNFIRALFNFTR